MLEALLSHSSNFAAMGTGHSISSVVPLDILIKFVCTNDLLEEEDYKLQPHLADKMTHAKMR